MQGLRVMPYGVHNFVSQRISGRNIRQVDEHRAVAAWHVENYQQLNFGQEDVIVEFGAGQDLINNLFLASQGYRNQIVIDIDRMVSAEKLNGVLAQPPLNTLRSSPFSDNFESELKELGIDYRAPGDMRSSGLDSNSVSAVTSTNTLEHIPPQDIEKILVECERVLKPGGVCSFKIDYSDHYAHTDPSITIYNFLKFSPTTWHWLCPPNHYQNRLRHQQFIQMFDRTGLDGKKVRGTRIDDWQAALARVRPHSSFAQFSDEELSIKSGYFLLQKPDDK